MNDIYPIEQNQLTRWGIGEDGEPSIRLIPRSGSDPDRRDEINQELNDKINEASAQLLLWERQLLRLAGSTSYTDQMLALSLTVQHAELMGKVFRWEKDLFTGLIAAMQEASANAPEMPELYQDIHHPMFDEWHAKMEAGELDDE
ncbi:MAG: hypothetical protein ACF8OB_20185 [Phycisphaeraceae bacterium JB051]